MPGIKRIPDAKEKFKDLTDIDDQKQKVLNEVLETYPDDKPKTKKAQDKYRDIGPIECAYIVSNLTMAQLGEYFGVSKDVLYVYSSQYNWMKKKRDFQERYKDSLQKLLKDNIIHNEIKVNNRHYEIWNKLLNIVDKMLDDPEKELRVKTGPYTGSYNMDRLSQISTIIQQTQNGQRLAKGIMELEKARLLDIQEQRLEMERQKMGLNPEMEDEEEPGKDMTEVLKDSVDNIWKEDK